MMSSISSYPSDDNFLSPWIKTFRFENYLHQALFQCEKEIEKW